MGNFNIEIKGIPDSDRVIFKLTLVNVILICVSTDLKVQFFPIISMLLFSVNNQLIKSH